MAPKMLSLALLALIPSTYAAIVSIDDDIVNGLHGCIKNCLYWPGVYTDMGEIMQCGRPYDNACYCATATAQASRAVSFVTACASRSCSAGDFERDLVTMQGIYATYCSQNGFLQPMVTAWLSNDAEETPSPGSSGDNGRPSETTQVTVVTETTGADSGVTGAPDGNANDIKTVQATSTLWVDSNGNVVDGPSESNSGSSPSAGLIVGLIVGIGLPLLAFIAFLVFCIRRRRRVINPHLQMPPPTTYPTTYPNAYPSPYPGYDPNMQQHQPPPMAAMAAVPPSIVSPPPQYSSPQPPPRTVSPPSVSSTPVPRKPVPAVDAVALPPVSPVISEAELSGEHVTREADGTEIHVFPVITPKSPVQVPGTHEVAGEGNRPVMQHEMGTQGHQPPRGVEMATEGHAPVTTFEMPVQGSQPPRGVEMATEGHAPVTTFEMPVQGHQPPRGVEMATEGHEPVTTFEMSSETKPPELGGQPAAPAPQQPPQPYQGGGYYREGNQAWELPGR